MVELPTGWRLTIDRDLIGSEDERIGVICWRVLGSLASASEPDPSRAAHTGTGADAARTYGTVIYSPGSGSQPGRCVAVRWSPAGAADVRGFPTPMQAAAWIAANATATPSATRRPGPQGHGDSLTAAEMEIERRLDNHLGFDIGRYLPSGWCSATYGDMEDLPPVASEVLVVIGSHGAGYQHLGVRIAIIFCGLPPSVPEPGPGWPELYGSYEEMAAVYRASAAALTDTETSPRSDGATNPPRAIEERNQDPRD